MAFIAATLGVEKLPAALRRIVDGVPIPRNEVIERRIERNLRPFVGHDGPHQVGAIGWVTGDLLKDLVVFLDRCDPGHRSIHAGLTHFNRIDDRQCRLLLERIYPAVPELRLVVESVQNGRGVALADAALDPDQRRLAIGESAGGIVTGTACDAPIGREATVKKQFLTEGDLLGRLRVASRDRLASQLGGEANLVERFGLGQRTRFGNRTRFKGGWPRRFSWRRSRLRTRLFARAVQTETWRSGGERQQEPEI